MFSRVNELEISNSIAVIGLGVNCAVGLEAPTAAAAVRAGIAGFSDHPYMIDKVGEPMVVAREPTLDAESQGPERFADLARPALIEALAPLTEQAVPIHSLRVLIGTPEPRPGLPNGISEALDRMVVQITSAPGGQHTTLLPHGNAAGLLAMLHARDLLLAGQVRFCVAGGVDSYLTADCLEWMDEQSILKSSANRNGFLPGEAAGFCLLASGETAREFELPVMAWLESIGCAIEKNRIRTETICVGRGLSDAIMGALVPLRMPEEQIDETICDLNGEPYRSEEFAFTVLRTQKSFVDFSRFVTPADCWGDVGAASGPLFASLAIAAYARSYSKGPRTMLWASSIGGDRVAIVLRSSSTFAAEGGGP